MTKYGTKLIYLYLVLDTHDSVEKSYDKAVCT